MSYFTEDYLDFFKELAAENNKEWFDANRKRYMKSVKEPFEQFITALIGEVAKKDKSIQITYKDAIFRINRDIRFSKDKTPYKLNRSAIISPRGRKDKTNPGLYIEAGPEFMRVYGGVYMPDKEQLLSIREHIAKDPKKLDELRSDKKFKTVFDEIRGDKNKILPKEFKELSQEVPILFHKQFYWYTQMAPETILEEDVIAKVMDIYETQFKLMNYFAEALR